MISELVKAFSLVFVAELGDKTQITALTFAARYLVKDILYGVALGVVLNHGLAIILGSYLSSAIPNDLIQMIAGLLFILFGFLALGLSKIFSANLDKHKNIWGILIGFGIVTSVETYLLKRLINKKVIEKEDSHLKRAASRLYEQTKELQLTMDSICLGEGRCGTCDGEDCLIGSIKYMLKEVRLNNSYFNQYTFNMDKMIKKDFDKRRVVHALALTIEDYRRYELSNDIDFIINKIRHSLEYILFHKYIFRIDSIDNYINELKTMDPYWGKELERIIESF